MSMDRLSALASKLALTEIAVLDAEKALADAERADNPRPAQK